jgi:hypothetical protein
MLLGSFTYQALNGYKPWFSPESHTYCLILLIINKIGKWITNCLVGGGGGGRERGGGGCGVATNNMRLHSKNI